MKLLSRIAHESMRAAVVQLVADGEDAPVNIAVTTDSTWMKQRFASLYDVQTCTPGPHRRFWMWKLFLSIALCVRGGPQSEGKGS